jgi:hypothetical protein
VGLLLAITNVLHRILYRLPLCTHVAIVNDMEETPMTISKHDSVELSMTIRKHNGGNPFASDRFSLNQIQALADFVFGAETSRDKEDWISFADGEWEITRTA